MTETITIECEWDDGQLRAIDLFLNGESVKHRHIGGISANSCADLLAKAVGRWKIEQDKRSVDPS